MHWDAGNRNGDIAHISLKCGFLSLKHQLLSTKCCMLPLFISHAKSREHTTPVGRLYTFYSCWCKEIHSIPSVSLTCAAHLPSFVEIVSPVRSAKNSPVFYAPDSGVHFLWISVCSQLATTTDYCKHSVLHQCLNKCRIDLDTIPQETGFPFFLPRTLYPLPVLKTHSWRWAQPHPGLGMAALELSLKINKQQCKTHCGRVEDCR